MEVEGHLQVESDKLGQVTVGVGVLGPEDGSHGEDLAKVTGDRHLLVQLRRLRQEGLALEVGDGEHARAALRGRGDDVRRVDLGESAPGEGLSEELAHAALETEDGLVGRRPEVEDPVVEPRVLVDPDVEVVLALGDPARGVLDLEGQLGLGGGDDPDLLDEELDVLLGAALDLGVHGLDGGEDVDDALLGDPGDELDHLLADGLGDEGDALDRVLLLAKDEETLLACSQKKFEIEDYGPWSLKKLK